MKDGGMEVIDCNNHVKSAIEFFGPSCAVNALSDKYNPLGENSHQLCAICKSDTPGVKCTSNDPYAGYQGALSCLFERGDIAFVKHSSVLEYFSSRSDGGGKFSPNFTQGNLNSPSSDSFPFGSTNRPFGFQPQQNQRNQTYSPFRPSRIGGDRNDGGDSGRIMTLADFKYTYDLLCPNGERRNIEDWRSCFWSEIPSHVVVTSSAKDPSLRLRYQKFIQNLASKFGAEAPVQTRGGTQSQQFGSFGQRTTPVTQPPRLFESIPRYGNRSNLLFSVIEFWTHTVKATDRLIWLIFQDATISLRSIPEHEQTYKKYLGEDSMKAILETRSCPVGRVTLCVTSDAEMTKCVKMKVRNY